MAIQHLDLQEQEQLDQLKGFWKQYGNLISSALIVVFGSIAAYNGYHYWQRSQAAQASTMYDQVELAALSGDAVKVERAFSDMKDKFGGTVYAGQAGLLAAKQLLEKGNTDSAKAALTWVAENGADDSYKAVAKLRLSALLVEAKSYDLAWKQLDGSFPKDFAALVADRRGDILMAQGKKPEAKTEYEKAYKAFDERTEYRRLVEVKLNSLGVDPTPAKVAVAAAPVTAPVAAATKDAVAKDAVAAPAGAASDGALPVTPTQTKPEPVATGDKK
jgi:predicted negative regulator of RcsB-dependent stress response